MHRRRKRTAHFRLGIFPLPRITWIVIIIAVITVITFAIVIPINSFLRELSASMALSDASDLVTLAINDTINKMMVDGQYDYDYFVILEKNSEGNITAIKTNMARINTLSSVLLQDIVTSASNGVLEINIPFGNLLGSNLMQGRGPNLPIKIIMLTSSYADFRNELSSAGINQTKHQIILELIVDIDIIIPWETLSTKIISEILVAETIIVGSVPDTYLKMEQP